MSPQGKYGPGQIGRPQGSTTISGRDMQIFGLHMIGKSNIEISVILGITIQTVSNTINTDYFRAQKAKVFAETIKGISNGEYSPLTIAKANASRMMALNVQIAETGKAEVNRLRAIHDILDRACGKATQRIVVDDVDSIIERMSNEELALYAEKGEMPEWAKSGNDATVH